MIDFAINYAEDINRKMRESFFNEKFKWYHGQFYGDISFESNNYNSNQFASLNSKGEVIGYIAYKIDRISESVYDFQAVNFSDDTLTFGVDLRRVFREIFEKFYFQKIEFQVVCGNPIERSYDKLVHNFGGRIVGILVNHTKIEGRFYDVKLYEILRTAYFNERWER